MTLGNRYVSGFAILTSLAACTLANPGYGDSSMGTASATDSATDSASATASASTSSSGSDSSAETSTTSTGPATSTDETSNDTGSSSGSTTSGDTSDDTNGDTTDDTSDDTNGTCGDGIKQDYEECEYMDQSDVDGCSENCHIIPTGIELDGKSWTSWKPHKTPPTDGESCKDGAMIRFAGWLDKGAFNIPCAPSFNCGILTLGDDLEVTTTKGYMTGQNLNNCINKQDNWDQLCPPNQVMVSLSGRTSEFYIHSLQFACKSITIKENPNTGFWIDLSDSADELMPAGNNNINPSTDYSIGCSPGEVVTGAEISDPALFKDLPSIRLECRELKLTFPP